MGFNRTKKPEALPQTLSIRQLIFGQTSKLLLTLFFERLQLPKVVSLFSLIYYSYSRELMNINFFSLKMFSLSLN